MGHLVLHHIQQYSGLQHKEDWHKMKHAEDFTYN